MKPLPQGRPRGSELDPVSGWLKVRIEAKPDVTKPELSGELAAVHGIRATPAKLSRHLIHRLGFTCERIADRNGAAAKEGARRATRMAAPAAPAGAEDAH